MKKILLLLLAYAGLGAITMLASVTFPNSITYIYNGIGGSGGTPMLSTSANEIIPKDNSPNYNPANTKAVSGSVVANTDSILIPQVLLTQSGLHGNNIVAVNMISGCKNHGYLYVIV